MAITSHDSKTVHPKRSLASVQALRGIWALLIVAFHATVMVRDRLGVDIGTFGGAAGVDLFFVISGFTMVLTTHHRWGKAASVWPFLKRRLIRIVPSYWLVTTIKLVLMVSAGEAVLLSWHTAASYLLIPAWNAEQRILPLLIPAWTLSFEIFFYLLIAVFLLIRKNPLIPLTVIFGACAAIGFFFNSYSFAPLRILDPQLLEFIFGMWIGQWVRVGGRLPKPLALVLMAASLAVIAATNISPSVVMDHYPYRFLVWGVPAAVLLCAAVSMDEISIWKWRLFKALGNASFAIYLTHDFAISLVRLVLQNLLFFYPAPILFLGVGLSVVLAIIGGYFFHRMIEKPLTRWMLRITDRSPRIFIYQRKPVRAPINFYFQQQAL